MIWLILILAIPGIYWVVHFTIIETARDHLFTWPATIFICTILLILVIGLSILSWCAATTIALSGNIEVDPQKLVRTIESKTTITVVNIEFGKTHITYRDPEALADTEIETYTSATIVRKSTNGRNYIEVYTATWTSPIRRFLYGKYIPGKYYIVYTTGD